MRKAGLKKQLCYLSEEVSTMRESGLKGQLSDLNEDLSTMKEACLKLTDVLPQ